MGTIKAFSFGGGVQSMAALVLSARGDMDFTDFVFSNVGNDSESPATIEYMRTVAEPYAKAHGLRIHTVQRMIRNGVAPTILEDLYADNSNIGIPVYLANGGPASRNCTSRWKVAVVERWMRAHAGATKTNRQPLGVGISVDESHRMRTDDPEREPYVYKTYPLIDAMMTRKSCQDIISREGLPPAPKSSCWFCPYKRRSEWLRMRGDSPELFEAAANLETQINAKRTKAGKDFVYLTASNRPLRDAISMPSVDMFSADTDDEDPMACESGYCMT
jgi:hypothetical protein